MLGNGGGRLWGICADPGLLAAPLGFFPRWVAIKRCVIRLRKCSAHYSRLQPTMHNNLKPTQGSAQIPCIQQNRNPLSLVGWWTSWSSSDLCLNIQNIKIKTIHTFQKQSTHLKNNPHISKTIHTFQKQSTHFKNNPHISKTIYTSQKQSTHFKNNPHISKTIHTSQKQSTHYKNNLHISKTIHTFQNRELGKSVLDRNKSVFNH